MNHESIAALLNSAQQQRVNLKFLANLLCAHLVAFVAEDGATRLDPQVGHARKAPYDSVSDAVGEVLKIGISAHVHERQNSYGLNAFSHASA